MKTRTQALLLLVLYQLIATSCSDAPSRKTDDRWKDTYWVTLEDENIQLRLPNAFKRSSRYRIEEDLPRMAEDSTSLRIMQDALKGLEFKDEEVDVYVDTTKTFRLVVICNIARIDFTPEMAVALKRQIQRHNEYAAVLDPDIEFGKVSAIYNQTDKLKLARYTTPMLKKETMTGVNHTIYYLTGEAFTLVIYEFSNSPELLENYLWTTKVE